MAVSLSIEAAVSATVEDLAQEDLRESTRTGYAQAAREIAELLGSARLLETLKRPDLWTIRRARKPGPLREAVAPARRSDAGGVHGVVRPG